MFIENIYTLTSCKYYLHRMELYDLQILEHESSWEQEQIYGFMAVQVN